MNNYILQGNIVLKDSIKYAQLIIDNDKFKNIIFDHNDFLKNAEIIDNDKFIVPGFIDLQINGGFKKELKVDNDALNILSDNLYKFGTTSFCPTITTIPIENYQTHINQLIENFQYNNGTKFLGFHLEGPALNPKKSGAQDSTLCKLPLEIDTDNYLSKNIRLVTLSPELEGSNQFIEKLISKNIKIGIGHSIIDYYSLSKIFDSNNMWIVHLFNAMEPLKSREPGVVGYGLNNKGYIGLIVDKVHLSPETIQIVWKLKSKEIIAVTDGSAVTGLESGTYEIGTRTMIKTSKKVTLQNGTLCGSILTQDIAVKNIMEINNCSLDEAIRTVSYNPAKFLGLEDKIGQIQEGNFADFCIIDNNLTIHKTYINGVCKYE